MMCRKRDARHEAGLVLTVGLGSRARLVIIDLEVGDSSFEIVSIPGVGDGEGGVDRQF